MSLSFAIAPEGPPFVVPLSKETVIGQVNHQFDPFKNFVENTSSTALIAGEYRESS